jgi:hypothetical protein
MTTEHKRRASEGGSKKSRSIPARDFPSLSASSRPGFNPKTSPLSAPFSASISAKNCKWSRPLLIDSALPIEFDVTHSKQRTGEFLTGARTHISVFQFSPKSAQNPASENPKTSPGFATAGTFLPGSAQKVECDVTYSKQSTAEFLPGATTRLRIFGTSICKWSRPLLTESVPQTEFVLTRSKQRTEKFLTEARTHIRVFEFWQISAQNPALISANLKTAKSLGGCAWLLQ